MNPSKFPVLRLKSLRLNFLRNLAYCEQPEDTKLPTVVTIIGGHTGEGQLTAFLLKQSDLVNEIRLYSGLIDTCGIALDLSHIDTNPVIKSYTGQALLKDAITNAQVVLICGGQPKKPCKKQSEIFEENADYVKHIATYMAEFNPKGIFCISTPPITALVPLVCEELKKEPIYDPRKVMGIMTLGVIRSNSLVAQYINQNADNVSIPVIGGICRKTIVPLFSHVKPPANLQKPLEKLLHEKICISEDVALDLKFIEHTGSCIVSTAFACARFVTAVLKGLKGYKDVVECAYVRQMGHIESFLPYMGSIVKLGPHGVESTHMPQLSNEECNRLISAHPYIQSLIDQGKSYIIGDLPRKCRIEPHLSGYCKLVRKEAITQVGDFQLDTDAVKSEEEKSVQVIW